MKIVNVSISSKSGNVLRKAEIVLRKDEEVEKIETLPKQYQKGGL